MHSKHRHSHLKHSINKVKPSIIDLKPLKIKSVVVGGWIRSSNKIENSNMLIN